MTELAPTDWSLSPDRTLIAFEFAGERARIECRRLEQDGGATSPQWLVLDDPRDEWHVLDWAAPALLVLWRRHSGRCELRVVDVATGGAEAVGHEVIGRPVACRVNRSGLLEVLLVLSDGEESVLCSYCPESNSYVVLAGSRGVSGVGAWDAEAELVVANIGPGDDSPGEVRVYRWSEGGYARVDIGRTGDVVPVAAAGHGGGVVGLTGYDRAGQPVPGVLELSALRVRWFPQHAGHSCGDVGPSGTRVLVADWDGAEFGYRVLDVDGDQVGSLRSDHSIATDLRFSRDERHVIGWHQSPAAPPAVLRWRWEDGETWPLSPRGRAAAGDMRWDLRWVSDVEGRRIPEWVFAPRVSGHAGTVLFLHGGPRGRLNQTYDPVIAALVGAGWTVVGMNYPGSSGYGPEYEGVSRGDWGGADARSIEWRLCRLAHEAGDRPLCLYGHSYGGYLALLAGAAMPRTVDRVAVWAPVVDLIGLRATAAGVRRQWLDTELGDLQHDERLLWERSPVSRIPSLAQLRLLVGHGRRDERCPVWQSRQLAELLGESRRPAGRLRYLEDAEGAHDPSEWYQWADAVVSHFGDGHGTR
ncbi:alpha/beta hydrolase family protein [Lentzea sp. HUAS TT2]|uniref:alpha/beta hydrolase family protein n=1 Tax=Lentzea sp. HUAS TT2 TaxID=3447454 RepID=UPI003F6EC761